MFDEADRRSDRDQDDHGAGGVAAHMAEQHVEGQRQEDPDGHLDQVGGDADLDESGVGDQVAGGGGRIAGHIHGAVDAGKGERAKDADREIEEPGDPREALGRAHGRTLRECPLADPGLDGGGGHVLAPSTAVR